MFLNRLLRRVRGEMVFPALIIALCAIAGIIFLAKGNIKKGLFWLFLAGANYCATF